MKKEVCRTKAPKHQKLSRSVKGSPQKLLYSIKGSIQKKKRSSRKLWKKSVPIWSRKSTPKNFSSESHFSTKDSSLRGTWKYRKKKSAHARRLPLKEIVSWKWRKKKFILDQRSVLKETASCKCRKKKQFRISRTKSVHHCPESALLRKDCAWKRKKKRRRHSDGFLYDVFNWDPGLAFKVFIAIPETRLLSPGSVATATAMKKEE